MNALNTSAQYIFHLFSGKMAQRLLTAGSEMNVNSEKYLFSTFTENIYQLVIVTWHFRVLYECLWSTHPKTTSDTT
jgi:hypothetical protein